MPLNSDEWTRAVDDFVDACARYEDGFAEKLVPASDDDLRRLEALVPAPLPPEYRAFLKRMGRTPAGTLGGFLKDTEFGIEASEAFYQNPPVPVPADAVYVWTVHVDAPMFLPFAKRGDSRPLLLFSWPVDPDTGAFIPTSPVETVISTSLLEYLYKQAFTWLRVPHFEIHSELQEPFVEQKESGKALQSRRAFETLALRLGFRPVPFVIGDVAIFERPDAALRLYSATVAPDLMYVDADDALEHARLCEIVSDTLGVHA